MNVLALDTSTDACSVALMTRQGTFTRRREINRGHAEEILPMIDAVLTEAGCALKNLSGIAAGVGPGSFTGVRIGVSTAQGLAYGADLPVVPITSLEALAFEVAAGEGEQALACLNARMGEVYWGFFCFDRSAGVRQWGELAVTLPALVAPPCTTGFHGIGRGFDDYPALKSLPRVEFAAESCRALPDASYMARLGALRLAAGEGRDAAELTPVYVRNQVALTEAQRSAARRPGIDGHGTVTRSSSNNGS